MLKIILLTLSVLGCFLVLVSANGNAQQGRNTPKLIVGTKEAPPFAIKQPDGRWEGISIDLWRNIASQLNLDFEFRERDLKGLLEGIVDGSLDLSIAALTITEKRETRLDFSHPYLTLGLGIAVPARTGTAWRAVARRLISPEFFVVVGILIGLLFGVGFLVWLFERRQNLRQFGGGHAKGIGSGFWWSAVTMTGVGYGDKTPITVGGRLVALLWMFSSIVIISVFTATITSIHTVGYLEGTVKDVRDLQSVRTATGLHSTSAEFLDAQQIPYRSFQTVEQGLRALADGQIDAFVYDAPLLQYLVKKQYAGEIRVLPKTFAPQYYGIAMTSGSPLRERINRGLLNMVLAPEWQWTLNRYLGE